MTAGRNGYNPAGTTSFILYHETITIASGNSNKMHSIKMTLFVHLYANPHDAVFSLSDGDSSLPSGPPVPSGGAPPDNPQSCFTLRLEPFFTVRQVIQTFRVVIVKNVQKPFNPGKVLARFPKIQKFRKRGCFFRKKWYDLRESGSLSPGHAHTVLKSEPIDIGTPLQKMATMERSDSHFTARQAVSRRTGRTDFSRGRSRDA